MPAWYHTNMGSHDAELLDEGLIMIEKGIQVLTRYGRSELGGEVLTGALRRAFEQGNRLAAAQTALVGELDRVERERPDGEKKRSVPTWLHWETRVTGSAAHGQVRLARQLPGLPHAAAAFQRGAISYQHTMTIAREVERVRQWGSEDYAGSAEVLLVEQARYCDPYELSQWARDLRHRFAPEDLAAEEREQHQRRYFSMGRRWDGMTRIEGMLDPEGAGTLRVAMEGLLGPRLKGDERTPGQRQADGLVGVARKALDSGQLPSRGGEKPHLVVTASVETLRGDPGAPAALLNWFYPISGEMARRIGSDGKYTPVWVQDGNPLWVGRTQRTVNKKLRLALHLRDRGCTNPRCDRPPGWVQGHHKTKWSEGGTTDYDNTESQCAIHHPQADEGYQTEILPDGRLRVFRPRGP
jgi:hypothetical protein